MPSVKDFVAEELSQLANVKMFTDWMVKELKAIHAPQPRGPNALDAAGSFISTHESPHEGFARIYEECLGGDETKKFMFRQAIGKTALVITSEIVIGGKLEVETLRDLIYLTARLRATEPLQVFSVIISEDDFLPKADILQYDFMSLLKLLSPSKEVREALEELMNSPNFNQGYLQEAMAILAETMYLK